MNHLCCREDVRIEIKDENLSVRDILKQNTGDASVVEGVTIQR